MMVFAAENIYDIDTPTKIRVLGIMFLRMEAVSMIPAGIREKRNALSIVPTVPTAAERPTMIERDAPKAALLETPSVYGVARGFFMTVCTRHPPMASIAPTNVAISTRGAYT